MDLRSERELVNTRAKLERLQALYDDASKEVGGDEELREMELESLQRLINQLKEEIARYEARRLVRR
jgi:hypothetical protein